MPNPIYHQPNIGLAWIGPANMLQLKLLANMLADLKSVFIFSECQPRESERYFGRNVRTRLTTALDDDQVIAEFDNIDCLVVAVAKTHDALPEKAYLLIETLRKAEKVVIFVTADDEQSQTLAAPVPENFHRCVVELCRCMQNTLASNDCLIGVSLADFARHLANPNGALTFGHGSIFTRRGLNAATDRALALPALSPDRLQRATAALVAIQSSPYPELLKDARQIMFKVRELLPQQVNIYYSVMPIGQKSSSHFQNHVSILVNYQPEVNLSGVCFPCLQLTA